MRFSLCRKLKDCEIAMSVKDIDNRLAEYVGEIAADDLFVAAFPGYDFSSNRLDYANYVLSWTTNNDWRAMRDHFVAITNQLHSSGRPLVELKLDESTSHHE